MAERFDLLKNTLHIPQVVDHIGQNDHIECLIELRKIMGVSKEESKMRIFLFCAADHLFGEVNAHTVRRLQSGKQASVTAAELENSLVRSHMEAKDLGQ